MIIRITPTTNPPGKLADAELHFTDGLLAGLKLIGFGVWERRTTPTERAAGIRREHLNLNVTFPARQYSVNGDRRSFALLRPIADVNNQWAVRDAIITAYLAFEAAGSCNGANVSTGLGWFEYTPLAEEVARG